MINPQAQLAIWRKPWLLALALVMLLLSVRIAIAEELLRLELIEDALASGSVFTVADIARYISGDEQLWQKIATEKLGYAPEPGRSIVFTRAALLGRLADRGYDWRAIGVTGPDTLQIAGAGQEAGTGQVRDLLEQDVRQVLGIAASFEEQRALPEPVLPAGTLNIRVRYPQKAGFWLPDAVEFSVDGLLVAAIPLAQYGCFRLPVVIAPQGIPGRTLIDGTHLSIEEREVRPGQEFVPRAADAIGMTTRSPVAAGAQLCLSRLQAAYDIARGSEITLVVQSGAVELRARAVALNNAYIGQRLLVERVDDGARFTGLVVAGPMVVME